MSSRGLACGWRWPDDLRPYRYVPFAGQPGWTRDPLKPNSMATGSMAVAPATSRGSSHNASRPRASSIVKPSDVRWSSSLPLRRSRMPRCGRVGPQLSEMLGDLPMPTLAWIGETYFQRDLSRAKCIGSFEIKVRAAEAIRRAAKASTRSR